MNKYKLLNISTAEHNVTGGRKAAKHIILNCVVEEETGDKRNEDVRSYKHGVYSMAVGV